MAFISETLQMRRLTESGVNIKTTYIVDGTLRYRSTDGTCQDDVHSGIRCRKEYFRQGKLLHTEKIFDSRMEYTSIPMYPEWMKRHSIPVKTAALPAK